MYGRVCICVNVCVFLLVILVIFGYSTVNTYMQALAYILNYRCEITYKICRLLSKLFRNQRRPVSWNLTLISICNFTHTHTILKMDVNA